MLGKARKWPSRGLAVIVVAASLATAESARAQDVPLITTEPELEPAPPSASPSPSPKVASEAPPTRPETPYSLPWALRPAAIPNLVRLDTSIAAFGPAGSSEAASPTWVTVLTLGLRISPQLGLVARGALVRGLGERLAATTLSNPLVGVLYAPEVVSGLRLGLFGAVVFPVGMGGGASPNDADRAQLRSASAARSSMDAALFAVNYLTFAAGPQVAYVAGGLTVQAEATLFWLGRTRGEDIERDPSRVNLTTGAHVGYAVLPWLVPSVELRHQRFLSSPLAVRQDPASRDTTTFAVGIRTTLRAATHVLLRPGIAYTEPLDDPLRGRDLRVVQLDVPIVFD